ncbi:hypothetical protein HTZ84_13110 [Haloterrigena sp. SYSU A558-1]|uniref:Uncharacterized protein n=1 Tax=Haloterrigena gelatinilytica TaxID=2741724 RepID=A0A8J8KH99_9EURY|nr:DUF6653 family protein [Haloterrigena gelatinilytica]NUB90944.1 hypothetical protein [Haloterrigena gelatinilytica]NUC73238.1 hypothetical protein [Haloterrigena gelatinilytica]
MTALEQFEETFWERHSNPKSGWSRTLLLPAILYAIYGRDWRIAAAAVAFTILNPLLFSPPRTDDAWMTRVVLAERWWTREHRGGLLELSYPNALNVLNVPTSGYAVVAAYRRQPLRAAVAGAAAMALKFWYVAELVRRYDARRSE